MVKLKIILFHLGYKGKGVVEFYSTTGSNFGCYIMDRRTFMSAVIAAICISTKKGVAKKPVAQAEFQVGFGIAGDVLDIMNLSH